MSTDYPYGLPVWISKKAFDRIEHKALFEALRAQFVDEPEIALLLELYYNQWGSVNDSKSFPILRGVKQGDVISAILFNAALEEVFRRWKAKLFNHGWLLRRDEEILTNTRYADDILLYAKSLEELSEMHVLLEEELENIGLAFYTKRT